MISCMFDINAYIHMYQSMLFGEVEIKTLGRGLHQSALLPLPSCAYWFLETAHQNDPIMTPDPHCAYQQPTLSYLFYDKITLT